MEDSMAIVQLAASSTAPRRKNAARCDPCHEE